MSAQYCSTTNTDTSTERTLSLSSSFSRYHVQSLGTAGGGGLSGGAGGGGKGGGGDGGGGDGAATITVVISGAVLPVTLIPRAL